MSADCVWPCETRHCIEKDEIFGPVLSVISYESEDEAP
ncbi:hypothetical protein [Mesorhizobium loti]